MQSNVNTTAQVWGRCGAIDRVTGKGGAAQAHGGMLLNH